MLPVKADDKIILHYFPEGGAQHRDNIVNRNLLLLDRNPLNYQIQEIILHSAECSCYKLQCGLYMMMICEWNPLTSQH